MQQYCTNRLGSIRTLKHNQDLGKRPKKTYASKFFYSPSMPGAAIFPTRDCTENRHSVCRALQSNSTAKREQTYPSVCHLGGYLKSHPVLPLYPKENIHERYCLGDILKWCLHWEGKGDYPNADVERKIAWIWYCEIGQNADEGDQNPKKCVDVI